MNLRRTLIQLSIKKQIYFSIFGLGLFICINVFLLILVLIVTLLNNKRSKMINTLEDKDNMLIELTGQYEVLLGEIFLIQTKNEILFHRIFNKILKEEYENLTKKLTKNRFNDNCSENKKYGCLQCWY
jgi:lipopolysaccharide export LptBFGC system permease protein LptF